MGLMRFTQVATTSSDEVFVLDADGQLWRYYWGPIYTKPDGNVTADRLWEQIPMPATPHA
jgi:hypothetical protein